MVNTVQSEVSVGPEYATLSGLTVVHFSSVNKKILNVIYTDFDTEGNKDCPVENSLFLFPGLGLIRETENSVPR